ncbi:hypothetical protein J2S43_007039 [Catenuloplanes nepalensis]|uniref:Uncharacterized protein n=1 Tax=Catenuloplanes nepalensis TaxID=587533 RepID=A0ABT9N4B1_9ACTN|nr:hypothetical protein [Catenuloplanes nepalensis]MDP9798527.1 hypothetical protein [Catenuloplanes nepalensis]
MRSRIARTSLAALVVALPLLTGAASATEESGAEVVFSGGGLIGLACGAKPSVGAVSLPAESTLRVVNQTGYRAKLILDGVTQGEIGKGDAAKVLFHRGPVSVALKPNCVLTEESASVRVSVRPPARVAPPAAPPAAPEEPAPAVAAAPPAAPEPRSPDVATRRPTPGDTRPTPAAAVSSPVPDLPAGTTGSARAPGATPSAVPSPSAFASALPDPLAAPLGEEPGTSAEGVAAEPVAAVVPVEDTGPVGLLALIATICVIGVSAGAIRAIIAQRVARAA